MARKFSTRLSAIKQQGFSQLNGITPAIISEKNIQILVYDFDGILAGHGKPLPDEKAQEHLKKMAEILGEQQLFILSNNPTEKRKQFFATHFPGITFITKQRKKPYPDGLEKIHTLTQCPLANIALIDDRLLTGALATCIARTQILYVKNATTDYAYAPLHEVIFWFFRICEQWHF